MLELDARGAPGVEAVAVATLSDAGRVRAENQDAVALIPNTSGERLLIVADGMGGHRGGETASRICLKTIERVFREPHGTPEQRLVRGFELANEEIYSHALANTELRGMGTTAVVALLAPDNRAWVAWVGDSRMYRLRAGTLEQLTADHSLMAEWITIGVITADAARTHSRRHELTRALGQTPDVVVDLLSVELLVGDRLLLCSDGLHGCVTDAEVARALASGVPDVAACALVDAANANGGSDNVSVIVAVVAAVAESAVAEPPPLRSTGFDTEPTVPMPESTPEPEPMPEPGPDLGFDSTLEFTRDPLLAREPEPEPAPELEAALEPAPEPAPELEPPLECAPEIAAELGALAPGQTFAEPDASSVAQAEAEGEMSFADLGAELDEEPEPDAPSAEPLPEASATRPPTPREIHPTPSEPIQIPRMTPVRARRALDATSLIVGVTTTLVVVGLGFALMRYTAARSTPEAAAAQELPHRVVRAAPAKPAPPAPAPRPPAPTPVIARAEPPSPRPAPPAAALQPATPVPTPTPPTPVAPAAPTPTAPSVPASPAPALAAPALSLAEFELTPEVERFLTTWLAALAADDRTRLGALGFPNEPSALAGAPGSRDGFRFDAADIDEQRSQGGLVYLRVILSYAFRDSSGRFRTQDEQRLIIEDVGGRLRFAGRWQQ